MNNLTAISSAPLKAASLSPLRHAAKPQVKADQVSLGQSQTPDPATAGKPSFPINEDAAAEKKAVSAGLSLATKVGLVGMAALSLVGCTKGTAPAPTPIVETQTQKDARTLFSQSIAQLEEQMGKTGLGDGQQQAEQFTSQFLEKAGDYAKQVGKGSNVALEGIRTELREHPAMAATVVFALGTASGVALEHYGVPASIKDGVSNIVSYCKEHKLVALAVGGAVAITAGALIYNLSDQVATVKAQIPAKPNTAEGKALDASFSQIEEQLKADPNTDSKDVTTKVMDAVSHYKEKTNKAWKEVANDVKAYAYDHPILAATVVAGAGVGTGVLLEKAGVPAELANVTGSIMNATGGAASSALEWAKSHPLVTGTGAAVVAAGVGYLAYQHFHQDAPAAAPTATTVTQN